MNRCKIYTEDTTVDGKNSETGLRIAVTQSKKKSNECDIIFLTDRIEWSARAKYKHLNKVAVEIDKINVLSYSDIEVSFPKQTWPLFNKDK